MSLALFALAITIALLLHALHGWSLRQRALARLGAPEPTAVEEAPPPPAASRRFLVRHRPEAALAGLVASLLVFQLIRPSLVLVVAVGVLVAILALLVESHLAAARELLFESQLGDAIDLMIGGLRAGLGLIDALETATRESRDPLREQLEEVAGRIRLGDSPIAVLNDFAERVPLDSVRLFTMTLSANWEVGGSLAPTLATVGRAIRDRLELKRRVEAQSTQARVSVMAVLGVSYFLGLVLWRADPARMERFLTTGMGANLAAGSLVLQALGLLWMNRLSRIEP